MIPNRAPPYRLSYNHPAWLELWEYFGADFKPEWCGGGDKKIMDEFARYPDAATFYRQTPVYCYHGPGYALEAVKRQYYAIFLQGAVGDVSVLDYGCGAGDDGLLFLQMGYEVAFADFPSQSVNFLRWRLNRRGYRVPVYEVGIDHVPRHEVVWCMDVLEHQPPERQAAFLSEVCGLAEKCAIINLVNDPKADGKLHYPVDFDALTGHADSLGDTGYYDFFEGRVRLLVIIKNARA